MSRLEQVMIAALAAGLAGSIGCETQRAGGAGDAQPEDRGPPETPYDGGGCTPAEQQVIPLCRLDAGPDAGPVADAGASDAGAGDGGSGDGGEGGPDDAAAPDMARPEAPPGCVPDLTGLGELSADLCYAYCGGGWNSDPICQVVAGGLECYWPEWCGVGRRPAGATPVEGATVADLGAWLGAAAGLEAAAVGAFEALAEHLRDLGAPADLVAACQAAAEDERRHTEAMRALAQRYGDDLRPWVAPTPTPSRFELALDNRLEGCVGETFGALVVAHQAQQAQDPAVAEAMAVIAAEEAAHAHLSWRLAAWLEAGLSAAERAALDAAVAAKAATLNVPQMAPAARALVGMPDAAAAQAMAAALAPLWALSPAAALAA